MRALSPAARQGVADLIEAKGGQIRGQMAHQAARNDVSDASATRSARSPPRRPGTRIEGIDVFRGGTTPSSAIAGNGGSAADSPGAAGSTPP